MYLYALYLVHIDAWTSVSTDALNRTHTHARTYVNILSTLYTMCTYFFISMEIYYRQILRDLDQQVYIKIQINIVKKKQY